MALRKEAVKQQIIKTHSWKDTPTPKYSSFPHSFEMSPFSSSPKYITDEDFDSKCPEKIKGLSSRHWTRVAIARLAVKFLVESPKTKVLDIGSGVGKFCIAGAAYTDAFFTGVEQRKNLCMMADKIAHDFNLSNTQFIHSNITEIDFSDYDAFYFYNSFHENMEQTAAIDQNLVLSPSLYHSYTQYLTQQLAKLPEGTRLVTNNSANHEVPVSYELQYSDIFGALKFWRKTK